MVDFFKHCSVRILDVTASVKILCISRIWSLLCSIQIFLGLPFLPVLLSSFSRLSVDSIQIGVIMTVSAKKLQTKIDKIYALIPLIQNFSTINKQHKGVNFINFVCAVFGPNCLDTRILKILQPNVKPNCLDTLNLYASKITNKIWSNCHEIIIFLYCSNYLTEPAHLYPTQFTLFAPT